jgi:hypothetical protein
MMDMYAPQVIETHKDAHTVQDAIRILKNWANPDDRFMVDTDQDWPMVFIQADDYEPVDIYAVIIN